MNWYDPLDDSNPVITPQAEIDGFLRKRRDVTDFGVSDRFLMLETGEDMSYLKTKYSIDEESFPLPAFLGKRPIYTINGESKISAIEKAFGAPVAVDVLETAIAMGCKRLFAFGLCGAISERLNIGDLVIATEIIREEGTSHHYAPHELNAKPDQELMTRLINFMKNENQLNVYSGKTVSTDAVFRQTLKKELNWRVNGVLGVDMEMSALLTVAEYHQIPAVCLLVVSDKHDLGENAQWHWGGEVLERNRKIAIETFIEFVRNN
jgi:uridine phosphorylase